MPIPKSKTFLHCVVLGDTLRQVKVYFRVGFLSFLLLKKAIKRLRKKIMAKRKKKTSQEEKENVESADLEGQTNLGFEPCEPGDIVKTRSKEDISTLNKNLANLEQAY